MLATPSVRSVASRWANGIRSATWSAYLPFLARYCDSAFMTRLRDCCVRTARSVSPRLDELFRLTIDSTMKSRKKSATMTRIGLRPRFTRATVVDLQRTSVGEPSAGGRTVAEACRREARRSHLLSVLIIAKRKADDFSSAFPSPTGGQAKLRQRRALPDAVTATRRRRRRARHVGVRDERALLARRRDLAGGVVVAARGGRRVLMRARVVPQSRRCATGCAESGNCGDSEDGKTLLHF